MTVLPERVTRSFISLQQRDFRFLTFSTTALGFGQWFQQIGLGWLVLEVTGSPAQMGTITFIQGVMILLSSLPAGVLSDRFSRRNVIIATTWIGVVQALALAALVVTNSAQTWYLYVFAFIGGLSNGITQPARQAFVYDVTEREYLTNALTVNSLAQNLARVSGPPLAGVMIGLVGNSSVFFALGVLNLIALWLTFLISPQKKLATGVRRESALASLAAGLRFSFNDHFILALLLASAIAPILVYPYVPFLPVFAQDVLHGGPQAYGLLASGVGWGSLVGLSALAYLGEVKRKGRVFIISHIIYVAAILAFARTDSLVLAMAGLIVSGIFWSIMNVMSNTLVQLAAPDAMRGRVMALYTMTFGLQPLGALPMGFAIQRWGAPDTLSVFMIMALIALFALAAAFPRLREAELSA